MKRLVLFAVCAMVFGCSGKPLEEKPHQDRMSFTQEELVVYAGEPAELPVLYEKWDRGVYVKSAYDFTANPMGVRVVSSDAQVAVVEDGQVKGLKEGSAKLTISSDKVKATGSLKVEVRPSTEPRPQTVKILYWNIQNGMWSDQGNNYDNFVKFVKDMDPDICIWAESKTHYKTDSNESFSTSDEIYLPAGWPELAARYGHEYTYVGAERDWFPQAITSKFLIENVERIKGDGTVTVSHGCGWAKIRIGDKDLNIVTVHTWPQKYGFGVSGSEAQAASTALNEGDLYREKEVKYICSHTVLTHPNAEKEYWIMAGDFNSESPADNFKLNYPAEDTRLLVHTYIRSSTPYVDVIEKKYPGSFQKSTRSGKRVDYVYMTAPVYSCVTEAEAIWDGFAASVKDPNFTFSHPSDHYPIRVTLEIR